MATKEIAKQESSALQSLANNLQVSPKQLQDTLKATAFRECKTDSDFLSAVIVANKYGLNPLLKEIYAFPAKGGGVTPIVSVDGFISLMNRQGNFDGIDLKENKGSKKNDSGTDIESVTATIYLKNRTHPVIVTEYMEECYVGNKEPWKKWPRRMLRHKALIQCSRVAFGFSGIYDPDEAERIVEAQSSEDEINAEEIEMPRKKIVEPPVDEVYQAEEQAEEVVASDIDMNKKIQEGEFDPSKCGDCGCSITPKVSAYSVGKFKMPLCFDCQKRLKGDA